MSQGAKETQKSYKYFDSPDGEDTFKKLWCVLKPTTVAATGFATVDVMCYSHPKGYIQTLNRYAYIGLPIIGATTAFVVATNVAASLRKKDDKLNWFIGGFVSGSVFGVWKRRTIIGFNMGVLLGLFAVLKKTGVQNGWTLFPTDNNKYVRGSIWGVKADYTLMAHRPGNWTTGPAKE